MSISSEIRDSFKYGSVLTRLIYVNIGVFLIFRFIQLFMVLSGYQPPVILPWLTVFSVPADYLELLRHFWTPVTYMFLHFDFLHLLFNVLYLYWFGRLFMHLIGESYLLRTYLIGGLAGALAFFLAYNFLPVFYGIDNAILMGASASVMAVLFTVARYEPNHKVYLLFFGEVRLKYIALAALIIDLISISNLNNTGGHLAHIGGSLVGLLLGWRWSVKGLPDSRTFMSSPLQDVKNKLSRKPKLSVAHKRPLTDYEYNALRSAGRKNLIVSLRKSKVMDMRALLLRRRELSLMLAKKGTFSYI